MAPPLSPEAREATLARLPAERLDLLGYGDFLREGYGVMDATAVSLSMENKLPIIVFDLREEGNIRRVVTGEPIGTLVH